MENNELNQLADILENKITSRQGSRSIAAEIFRNAQCVYNDYRSVKMLNMTFNYLIQKFQMEEGSIKLTNTSKHIGDIVINVLQAQESNSTDAKSIMMGDFILDILITHRYLVLHREPFFRVEEVYHKGNKKQVNYNPYKLEIGEKFIKIKQIKYKNYHKSGKTTDKTNKSKYELNESRTKLVKACRESQKQCFDDQIDALVAIKSREELIGEVIGLLQSPVKNVISALQSGGQTLSGILKTLSEK